MDTTKWFSLHFLSNMVLVLQKVVKDSAVDQATADVKTEVSNYQISITNAVSTMQAKEAKEEERQKVLEWICSSNGNYLMPKRLKEVKDTCQAFLKSNEYLSWAGPMPSTLICECKRTSHLHWKTF